ncbi:MAG: hypothetical protein GF364_12345 [Candidatus Lokiarchaeota archaeon]|nr:hypothetical protein [Candidatus Lokiarchaeota archaeon]
MKTNISKRRFFYLSLISLLIGFQAVPLAYAKQSFPDSFQEIDYMKYVFSQVFSHYEMGTQSEGGYIGITLNDVLGDINFSINHELNIWIRSCTEPHDFDYDIRYRVNPNSRLITYVDYSSSGFDASGLKNKYCYYFIDKNIQEGDNRYILHDDLMIFRGVPFHYSQFHCVGIGRDEDRIKIQGDYYDTIRMQFDVNNGDPQLFYTGSVCGLGTGIFINATINLYYEIKSGMLLYSTSDYLEYYAGNPTVQQRHLIQRTIEVVDYPGETGNGFVEEGSGFDEFWQNEANRIGVFSIIGIILITIVIMMLIRRRSIQWKYEAIKSMINAEDKLKLEIKKLRKEIENELNATE